MGDSRSTGVVRSAVARARLTALRNWLQRNPAARRLYRCLPTAFRERMSMQWVRQMVAASSFPVLPPVPAPEEADDRSVVPSPDEVGSRGVNLFAYFRGEFGLAESARLYARALFDYGYPVALNDIDLELPHGFGDRSFDSLLVDIAPYPINVIFVNPDHLEAAFAAIGEAKLQGRHVIACWFWELERVPGSWMPAIAHVDEILVASRFVEQAFLAVTDKRVTRVPLPVPALTDSGISRADFGLEADVFIFLASFDFNSWMERKNPLAVIEAFGIAFPNPDTPVRLLIKTSNGNRHPEMLSRLLDLSRTDPRILVREGVLDRAHLRSLQRCCDAYVSLHRSEGFGLGLAECMALGKPVIATAWSGNCDFMSPENSCLVSSRLIEVGVDEYLHGEGQRWAAVDLDEAASHMRRVFNEPSFAAEIGKRAAEDVARQLSPSSVAATLVNRLDQIAADTSDADVGTAASHDSEGR